MINAKVDGVSYEGIEKITAGGKTVELTEVFSGSKVITANGTHDVSGYAQAMVDVSSGGGEVSGTINITENGTFDVSGYASANVNVEAGDITADMIAARTAFADKAVTLENATAISGYAFYNEKMKTLTCPKVETIDAYACYNATYLIAVDAPVCTKIYRSAFEGCRKMQSINAPETTTVDDMAFMNCSALLRASFPKCEAVNTKAFSGCTTLETVDVSAATSIEAEAFYRCASLKELMLPNNTTASVPVNFLNGCTSLGKLDLGFAKTIPQGAIFGNGSLELILRSTTMVTAGSQYAIPSNTKVYVPSALIAEYRANELWAGFIADKGVTINALEGSEYE